jgi:hypothetical protein
MHLSSMLYARSLSGSMTGKPVAVGSMRLDPAVTSVPGRARYRITLQCGCSWWEEYPVANVPSRLGAPAHCYNERHLLAGAFATRAVALDPPV